MIFLFVFLVSPFVFAQGENEDPAFSTSADLKITQTSIVYNDRLEQLIFTIQTEGSAGNSVPTAFGKMDGAPVLGYVFPTTLQPVDVGFSDTEGIVAMALTSHPDFDDTPLWDENNDRNYANDGVIWHPHWVVLAADSRVPGGLAVKQFDPNNNNVTRSIKIRVFKIIVYTIYIFTVKNTLRRTITTTIIMVPMRSCATSDLWRRSTGNSYWRSTIKVLIP